MSRMRETAQQQAGHQLPMSDMGQKASKKSKSKKSRKMMGNSGHK